MAARALRPDCARCAALCCVALAFDKGPMFAFDKANGEPCRHLDARHGCAIHDDLAGRGFAGCAAYDCLGAGQRVTQEFFAGRSWRDDPALRGPMLDAFAIVTRAHELLLLLEEARKLPLGEADARARAALQAALEAGDLGALDAASSKARAFLTSLQRDVAQTEAPRS